MTNRTGCLLAVLMMATQIEAHHSFGTFDLNRKVEIAGTIAMLCTPDCAWTTGSVVSSNGGFKFSY